jgi:alpha-L-fucosidase
VLIDIVSKNGVLLLNISPIADGTIPDDQRQVLLDMGSWLKEYGEAIYATRPWYTYGEGPTKEPEGHFKNNKEFLKIKYSAKDIRYTTKGDIVYAILLGWPGSNKEVLLEAFAPEAVPGSLDIKSVDLLGWNDNLLWEATGAGLKVLLPENAPDEMAAVLKIKVKS